MIRRRICLFIGMAISAAPSLVRNTAAQQQQATGIGVVGVGSLPKSTLTIDGNREVITGSWVGVAFRILLEPVVIEGSALTGTLERSENTVAFSRDGGELRGLFRIAFNAFFGIEGGYTLRAFDSPAGYQRWDLPMVGARFGTPLGVRWLDGFIRGTWMPAAKVSGQPNPELAIAGEAGFDARPPGIPISIGIAYRIERYDFPAGETLRIEQYENLQIYLGLRLGQ